MQKIILLLLIIFSQILFGQNKITETEKLAATCKVWGFLKYYHPKVAAGEFNWDQQLIDILPKIEEAHTRKEYSLIISNWIDSLGEVPLIAPIALPKDVKFFDKKLRLIVDKHQCFIFQKSFCKIEIYRRKQISGQTVLCGRKRAR